MTSASFGLSLVGLQRIYQVSSSHCRIIPDPHILHWPWQQLPRMTR